MFLYLLHFSIFYHVLLIRGEFLKLPCPSVLTVDITNGQKLSNGSIIQDDVLFDAKNYFKDSNNTIRGCICNIKNCIRKCCGPQERFVMTNCTKAPPTMDLKFFEGTTPVNMQKTRYIYSSCQGKKRVLLPKLRSSEVFYLQKNGSLLVPGNKNRTLYLPEEFCVENFDYPGFKEASNITTAFLCLTEKIEIDNLHKYLVIGKFFILHPMIVLHCYQMFQKIHYCLV